MQEKHIQMKEREKVVHKIKWTSNHALVPPSSRLSDALTLEEKLLFSLTLSIETLQIQSQFQNTKCHRYDIMIYCISIRVLLNAMKEVDSAESGAN